MRPGLRNNEFTNHGLTDQKLEVEKAWLGTRLTTLLVLQFTILHVNVTYVNTLTDWHCPPNLVGTISLISTGLALYSGRSQGMRLPRSGCVKWGSINTGWHINVHHAKKLYTHEV